VLEWLIAALVIINVVFLSVIFFFLKIKETGIDPVTLSLMGSGDPKKMMMMQMMGGKMDPMKWESAKVGTYHLLLYRG